MTPNNEGEKWEYQINEIPDENEQGQIRVLRSWLIAFISKEVDRAREVGYNVAKWKAIKLSDKVESENYTVFDEWRAFKQFRNTLRDDINKSLPTCEHDTLVPINDQSRIVCHKCGATN